MSLRILFFKYLPLHAMTVNIRTWQTLGVLIKASFNLYINDLRWEAIGRFVDNGWIVDHCLNTWFYWSGHLCIDYWNHVGLLGNKHTTTLVYYSQEWQLLTEGTTETWRTNLLNIYWNEQSNKYTVTNEIDNNKTTRMTSSNKHFYPEAIVFLLLNPLYYANGVMNLVFMIYNCGHVYFITSIIYSTDHIQFWISFHQTFSHNIQIYMIPF